MQCVMSIKLVTWRQRLDFNHPLKKNNSFRSGKSDCRALVRFFEVLSLFTNEA